MDALRIPLATYRLQFNERFRFVDARPIVAYLERLGISDVYASPLLKACAGSLHGYNVTDHTRLNPEIGSDEEFEAFSDELRGRRMGLILDIVPNHMGIDEPSNEWWQDVLENGPSSPFAKYFDIDWNPPKRDLRNRVLLPFLGDQYGKVLENGEITLCYEGGAFQVAYYERRFPIDPRSARRVLQPMIDQVRYVVDEDDADLIELESVVTALGYLPERTETNPEKVEERQREKEVAKRRLAELVEASGPVRRALDAALAELNGRRGNPRSFDVLEALLAEQSYRLCYWRVAADEINYRRFFDINDLAAIRVEDPEVFQVVHQVAFRLLREGRASGLRIDHPDGLFDPERYFLTIQAECRRAVTGDELVIPSLPVKGLDCACYVAVEKILCDEEKLSPRWSVHGTTGYEMMNLINGVFVDPGGAAPLRQFYARFYGRDVDFKTLVYRCKKTILDLSMSSELNVLARRLDRISEQHRWSRDFTFLSLYEALGEVTACFPVYRTYIQLASDAVGEDDLARIGSAVQAAKRRNPGTDPSIFDFIASILLLDDPPGISDQQRAERREFVIRFQQLTGPVMAKGVEDTAFYQAYPLASLNEVGGEPAHFGASLEEFHAANAERVASWPYAMTATATHDMKRGEDVRARINVLSEMPDEWAAAVERWQRINRGRKNVVQGHETPDPNEEYLLYQTLVGCWPLEEFDAEARADYTERMVGYMEKALREAKRHTSWVSPNVEYDQAVAEFVRAVLADDAEQAFLNDLREFQAPVAYAGMLNSLSQTLLKMTVPGVPDFYQGAELWDLSLVDPDNRRPVDFAQRAAWLDDLDRRDAEGDPGLHAELLANWRDGRVKLHLTTKTLRFRRQHAELFQTGEYIPLTVEGRMAEHIGAFARRQQGHEVIVVVSRRHRKWAGSERPPLGAEAWAETDLLVADDRPRRWTNVLTGQTIEITQQAGGRLPLASLLDRLPVALLYADGA